MAESVNYVFLLSLTIIILGNFLKRWNVISEENGRFMAQLIFKLTLPAVILDTVPYVNLEVSLLVMPLISFGFSAVVVAIGFILFKEYPREEKGLILMTIIGFNVGNFAYPLIEGIWGEQGLQYIAMFDVGNAFTIFALMYIIGAIFSPKTDADAESKVDKKEIFRKVSRSVPLLCYIIGLIVNVSGFKFPMFVQDVIGTIARANMMIVLLTLGVFLDFNFEKSQWNNIIKVLLVRYAFGIGIGLLLYFLLPFSNFVKVIIFVGLILPLGMGALTFSVEFGYDEKVVGTINNITILISFGLMWLIVLILG